MSAGVAEKFASIGLVEWLRVGDADAVERLIRELHELRVTRLRTQFSWADWHTAEGKDWYEWLIPRLAAECELLPCFCYTPPSLGLEPRTSAPPRDSKAYADFLDVAISRFGSHFEWVELWNEPNNLNDWDWQLDHDWRIFSSMIGQAAHWARHRGKRTLLGGMCPTDPHWLALMARRGVLDHIDAVGLHGFPGTWDIRKQDWHRVVDDVRHLLSTHGLAPQIWLSETGYSTWRHDGIEQVRKLRQTLDAPVERIYWYAARDLPEGVSHQEGFHEDERHYHFGLRDDHGRSKLLYRVWAAEGLAGIDALTELHERSGARLSRKPPEEEKPAPREPHTAATPLPASRRNAAGDDTAPTVSTLPLSSAGQAPVLITGGAGFIGTNLAARLLENGRRVLIFDNLSRAGVERNLLWLCDRYPDRLQVEIADVRDRHLVRAAVSRCSQVFHLAAQVAVTSSLEDPRTDLDINLQGSLNVLEAVRSARRPPPLVFTSTNKVYGALDDVALDATSTRYQPRDRRLRDTGIGEARPLDFHSPYGCSKGGADQYVLDYARSFGLSAVVLRMSCIYGPHQFGNEDQGWVAHFLIRALEGRPLTLYGDGKQVRDILFVEDLVDALLLCQARMPALSGRAFNMGGGPANTVSLVELLERIGTLTGSKPAVTRAPWRTGDQRYYVSDTSAFAAATGWSPQVSAAEGVARLHAWLQAERGAVDPARTHAA